LSSPRRKCGDPTLGWLPPASEGTPLRECGGSSPHYDGSEQLEPGQLSWTADRLQDRHGGVTVPVINCPLPISPPDCHDRL
jgi:hypothetical protein